MNAVILVAAMALTTAALRFLPFLLFEKKTLPFVVYLGKVLPAALIGMLVVYCLKDVQIASAPHGLPELIAGAAVDVFSAEPPLPPETALLQAPNTLLTPHIAFATRESMSLRARIVFDNLRAWLDGGQKNVIL